VTFRSTLLTSNKSVNSFSNTAILQTVLFNTINEVHKNFIKPAVKFSGVASLHILQHVTLSLGALSWAATG